MENSDGELLSKYQTMPLDPQAGGGSTLDPPQSLGAGRAAHADSGEGNAAPAIHRIPIELICEILTLTLPYPRRLGDRTVEQVPWHLGHICQQWRAAAIMSPLLWSSITLACLSMAAGSSSQPHLLTKVETQLNRSSTAPLHVVFDSCEEDIVEQCFVESMDLIIDQCHRWETARLILNHASARQVGTQLARMKDKLSRLRLLELISQQDLDDILQETFATAPRLETVFLCECTFRPFSISSRIQFPWAQITKFRISCARVREFEGIFAAMNLAHVIELGMFVGTPSGLDSLHVVLPNLFRLSAQGSLNYITAPLLQELWVTDFHGFMWNLPPFIQRSACRLSKLVVYGCSDTTRVIRALEALTTLKTFFISFSHRAGIGDPESLFCALNISSSETTLCPKLTHIAAGNISENAISLFLDMVESRRQISFAYSGSLGEPETWSAPSFVRVFHHGDMVNDVSEDTYRQVKGMRSEGLDIALDSHFVPSSHNYLGCDRP
ncbi:F-box domain-containing protein [Favolaschia claudopus]|uniref:F-box domain-containing protein n=1 Tax=Favolaschia claudopus TaxID=2862362 RepID=A0AAW0DZL4_9AGAR